MRKFLKWTGITLLLVICIIVVLIFARQDRTFDAPYPSIKASRDSSIIARGREIVYGPAHCAGCHGAPGTDADVDLGKEVPLSGGRAFDLPIGTIYAKNLTPHATGIGEMTDAEFARTLRYGVNRKGRALFDFMPFHNTSDEDLVAIISYLRQQPAVENKVPENKMNLLGMAVNAFLLDPVGPSGDVPVSIRRDTGIAYGQYLAESVANCKGCHTNRDLMTGKFTGEPFAGGLEMEAPTDSGMRYLTTPNLTPDPATGRITNWTQQQFIDRFRRGRQIAQSHMPWGPFRRMTDDDLKAIYNFLRTVKPVSNKVPYGLFRKD